MSKISKTFSACTSWSTQKRSAVHLWPQTKTNSNRKAPKIRWLHRGHSKESPTWKMSLYATSATSISKQMTILSFCPVQLPWFKKKTFRKVLFLRCLRLKRESTYHTSSTSNALRTSLKRIVIVSSAERRSQRGRSRRFTTTKTSVHSWTQKIKVCIRNKSIWLLWETASRSTEAQEVKKM